MASAVRSPDQKTRDGSQPSRNEQTAIIMSNKCFQFTLIPVLIFVSFVEKCCLFTQNPSAADSTASELDVFQLLQLHQEKATRLPAVAEIRTILYHYSRGMLSTFSQKHEGYPSGSIVDFACDAYGSPILAVSRVAVHTKDLLTNPRCSLLIARDPEDRTDLTIILYGDAISISEEDRESAYNAYLSRHPNAFGVSTEFSMEEYIAAEVDPIYQFSKPISSHMNKDHSEDTKLIVQHATSIPVDSAHMLDLDSLGFNVKAIYQGDAFKLRIPFPRRAVDRKDVRTLVIEMLQASKSRLSS
ncbi:glutamyl-tRNA reductase-binding protein, chloroplastic isoform X4 [Diospyros lotus]|uniref:glutamyl-tRNA reductase-binding protein, chloroplastic isoform X4 n=1 Tax=Diospyros lotus TaxID=55363 RepID=UPI002251AC80|nr:glutamyl-tRNA reductase-binding protein, chloroplastic isoform X4 [Diospyros lotus]